jgi:hypothetical protein
LHNFRHSFAGGEGKEEVTVNYIGIKSTGTAVLALVCVFMVAAVYADTFTENFLSTNYEDTALTTANWDILSPGYLLLPRVQQFVETTGVISWGSGVTAMDCTATAGGEMWLIGGYSGKINSYDGSNFVNLSTQLPSTWGTSIIRAIKVNVPATYWLIGGDSGNLVKWDGNNTWTTLTLSTNIRAIEYGGGATPFWLVGGTGGALYRYDGANPPTTASNNLSGMAISNNDILAIAYTSKGNYWLIGGKNGKLSEYNGSGFTDLSPGLNWTVDINAIDWYDNGGANGMFLIGGATKSLATYDGASFISHTDDSGNHFSTINAIKWTGTYWILGGSSGGGGTQLTDYNGGTSYYDYPQLPYFKDDPCWAVSSDEKGDSAVNLEGGGNSKLNRSVG